MSADDTHRTRDSTCPSHDHDPGTHDGDAGSGNAVWADDKVRTLLAQRVETFWNPDQLELLVVPQLRVPLGGTVLDVGCGPGSFTIPLARALPSATVVGLDLEEAALEQARSLANDADLRNVAFHVGDATALPMSEHEVDATACQAVLTHVPDPLAVLREMIRVTRPGGAILVVEYDTPGTFIRSDDLASTLSIEERVWRFEMALRFIDGKRSLGRGDERLGSRVPLLLQDLGCTVEDVRIVDRVWRALPPFSDPRERIGLRAVRAQLEPESDATQAWAEACFRAGGVSDADLERMRGLERDDPWSIEARAMLDAGTYRYVSALARFATVARTPDA